MADSGLTPAPFVIRMAAGLLDLALLATGYTIILKLVPLLRYPYEMAFCVNFIIFLAYFVGCTRSKWGATPGKWLLGLVIVDDRFGRRLSNRDAVLRALWLFVPFLPALCVYYIFYPSNMNEHIDEREGTYVIEQKILSHQPLTEKEQKRWDNFQEHVQKPITNLWLLSISISQWALLVWEFTMLTNRQRKGVHDFICSTMVIYKRSVANEVAVSNQQID